MTTLAVTGHMNVTHATIPLVRDALRHVLSRYQPGELTGVSCLAAGADTLFAEAVLEVGGRLVAVIPPQDYRATKVKAAHADTFDRLTLAAHETLVMPHETANRAAYESANAVLLERADRLVAVWDGNQPVAGKGGGTADVVVRARQMGKPVDVVWPEGARRDG